MDQEVPINGETNNEDETLGYGGSLPVPSVQEMVRKDSQSVPDKYIKEEKDRPLGGDHPSPYVDSLQVPVVDLSLLINEDEGELQKLDSACKEWGFFQVVNHGIEEDVPKKMKAAVAAFFELPLEEKKKYAMAANDIQGYGQSYVVSDEQKLDWGDMMFLMASPSRKINFNRWPLLSLPGFKEALEGYSEAISKVSEDIFGSVSSLLGMERDVLKKLHREMQAGVRMNYYPPCSKPDLVLGFSPHSDITSITLLLQDDHVTGLQVRHNGHWVPVRPNPGALVVNVGDVMESWTNGLYKSIEHRAVINEASSRTSIATFLFPEDEVDIGPLEDVLINGPRMYKSIKYVDYLVQVLRRKNEGKSANMELLKIKLEDK